MADELSITVRGAAPLVRQLNGLARAARDFRPFFNSRLAPMVSEYVQLVFETEGASEGRTWAPKVNPGRLMYQTGALYRAATNPRNPGGSEEVSATVYRRSVTLLQALNAYRSRYRRPARPFFVITRQFADRIVSVLADDLETAARA